MASGSAKKEDNTKRLRYIRVLERFSKSIINYLFKTEELSRTVYDKKIDNNLKYLQRIEGVKLYKGEYNDLEALVNRMIGYRNGEEEIEVIKDELLYASNQLEKSMNQRRYKKDKHESEKFKDWE